MTYKDFCIELAPSVYRLKRICKDMTPKEFEEYKQWVKKTGEATEQDSLWEKFVEAVFGIVDPCKEKAVGTPVVP